MLREHDSSMSNEEFISHISNLTEVAVVPWVIRTDGQDGWKVNTSYIHANGIVQPRVRLFRSWNEQIRHYLARSHRLLKRNQRHRHGLFIQYHNVEVDYIDPHKLREMYARVPALYSDIETIFGFHYGSTAILQYASSTLQFISPGTR